MKYVFVVTTEDTEMIGAAGTLEMAHNFCREYANCNDGDVAGIPIELPIDNVMDLRSGPMWRVRCVPQPEGSGFEYDLFIDRVDFFTEGTLFRVDSGMSEMIEVPAFLRRQAD